MRKMLKLLQKIGVVRSRSDEEEVSPFEKRLKKVNRARVVNQQGLGGPVFKSRQTEPEA